MEIAMIVAHVFIIASLIVNGMAIEIPKLCFGSSKTEDLRGAVLRVHLNSVIYTEHSPKCYPMRRWVHASGQYSLTCYKRADTWNLITLYRGDLVVDSALVEGCEKTNDIAGSVAIVSQQDPSVVVVQYELSPNSEYVVEQDQVKFCKQVTYFSHGEKRNEQADCESLKRRIKASREECSSAWKEKKVKIEGYVNSLTDINTEQCKYLRGWKCGVPDVILQCFNCDEEMVAQINYKGTTLAGAAVGTCKSPLEESFNVVSPKKEAPDTVAVQFWMRDGGCVKKFFNLKEKSLVGNAENCKGSAKWANTWRPLMPGSPFR